MNEFTLLLFTDKGKRLALSFETREALLTSFDIWKSNGGVKRNKIVKALYIIHKRVSNKCINLEV